MQFDQLRRRELIMMIGGAATAWPLAAPAQQSRRPPTIGFLGVSTSAAWTEWTAAFVRRLDELGWAEGRTVAIEYRWAEGRGERYVEYAAEFVRLNVDVIVTGGSAIPAIKRAAVSTIPIVFALAVDPIAGGLVTSLARPGGNVTGLSALSSETASKRLEILREAIPGLRRLAVMGNVGGAAVDEMREVQTAAQTLGVEIDTLEIRKAEDISAAFEQLTSKAQALYICPDALINANRVRISIWALGLRLPTMFAFREYVDPAGLMSYGPSIRDLFRRAAEYVDKILRGTKPGELPVEQPTRFELVINLTVAKALGLRLPETFLLRADEVIE